MPTTKVIVFLRAPGPSGTDFQRWYAQEYAPALAGRFPQLAHHIVNVTEEGPPELRLAYDSTDPLARYDVVSEMQWTGADYRKHLQTLHDDLDGRADLRHIYRVSERVILAGPARTSSPLPGIKFFRELYFYADMSDAAVKRCWLHHADLARKVHVGASRYVQHWVEERLSPGCPAARGIVEFYFATRRDLVERYYVSPAGRDQIVHDTGHFIERRLPRAYARERTST